MYIFTLWKLSTSNITLHGYIELAKKFKLADFCKSLQKTLNEPQPNKRMKFNRCIILSLDDN